MERNEQRDVRKKELEEDDKRRNSNLSLRSYLSAQVLSHSLPLTGSTWS